MFFFQFGSRAQIIKCSIEFTVTNKLDSFRRLLIRNAVSVFIIPVRYAGLSLFNTTNNCGNESGGNIGLII